MDFDSDPPGNGDYHVVPVDDLKEHDLSHTCWCKPLLDAEADALIYIHNSLDGRERDFH